jgi:hypothetical protein
MGLTPFQQTMITAGHLVPAPILRDAYTAAVNSKDLDAQATIVARPDCPAELVDLGRRSRNLEVRAAYLSRPGHIDDTRMHTLTVEKATGALDTVAAAATTPAAILDLLVSTGRPTVLAAAVTNVHAPTATRRDALRLLDTTFTSLSTNQQATFESTARNTHAVPDADTDTPIAVTCESLARILLEHRMLSEADRAETIAHWLPILINRSSERRGPLWRFIDGAGRHLPTHLQNRIAIDAAGHVPTLAHLGLDHLNPEILRTVTGQLTTHIEPHDGWATTAAALLANQAPAVIAQPWGPQIIADLLHIRMFADLAEANRAKIAAALAPTPAAGHAVASNTSTGTLVEIHTSTDPARLAELALPYRGHADDPATDALLDNPHTPPIAGQHLLWGGYRYPGPVLDRFPGDPGVLGAAVGRTSGTEQAKLIAAVTGRDDATAITAITLDYLLDRAGINHDFRYGHCTTLQTITQLDAAGLLNDPALRDRVDTAVLDQPATVIYRSSPLPDRYLNARVMHHLDAMFTTNPATYEAFSGMFHTWDASTRDLMDACLLLHGAA